MDFYTVKITQPGWEGFSGEYVGYHFKDGVSTTPMPRNQADRVAACVACEIIDAGGDNLGQGGVAARIASGRSVEATVGTALDHMTPEQHAAELLKAYTETGVAPTRDFYTADQLESVASLEGIEGLRKLAEPWKVKDRSIPRLVARIVKAQNDFLNAKKDLEERMRAARAAALDDAQAKQHAEEQALLAKARVLQDDQTPNAVDANGKAIYSPARANGMTIAPAADPSLETIKARVRELTTPKTDGSIEITGDQIAAGEITASKIVAHTDVKKSFSAAEEAEITDDAPEDEG